MCWMLPCERVPLLPCWWPIVSPVSWWLIGRIVQRWSRRAHFSWQCPTRRAHTSLSRRAGLSRCRWRRTCFRASWSPAPMTRSDHWPMPHVVRWLGGAPSSISARQGTSTPTAGMVNGMRGMLCCNNSWPGRMLKQSASFVLDSSKSSTYSQGYASGFDSPAALPAEGRVLARWGWVGEKSELFEHPTVGVSCCACVGPSKSSRATWLYRALLTDAPSY